MPNLAPVFERTAPPPLDPPEKLRKQIYFESMPHDYVTWLPYSIAPPPEYLHENSPHTSWHHAFHDESYMRGLGDIGRALRGSRLQLARNIDHNQGPISYHGLVRRVEVPGTETSRIGLVVLESANAVADKVLDIREQKVRKITDSERQRLFRSGEIRMQSDYNVKRVLTRFVIERGMDHLKKSEVRRYKDAYDLVDRKRSVNSLIGKFLPIALADVNKTYRYAQRHRFLPDVAPSSPAEVARQFVFTDHERFREFDEVFMRTQDRRRVA